MPDGEGQYKSFLGSIFSIITLLTMLSYASYKFTALISYSDYKIQVSDQENFYTDEDFFGNENGFMFAAGVTNYDG